MTDAGRRTSRRRIAATLVIAAAGLAACRSPRTPDAPPRPPEREPGLRALLEGNPRALQPYLEAYPLGDRGSRIDLLATTKEHSLHLVQAVKPIPRHYHRERTETVYVLTGSGMCYIGDRSYPALPGSAFKIPAGTVHLTVPEGDRPLVAVVYFEPPLLDVDDRVAVP